MKKITTIVILIVSLICLTSGVLLFGGYCKETEEVVKPAFTNIQVDVTDSPTAFSVGTYDIESVEVNGKKLDESKYRVKNGYFIFTAPASKRIRKGYNL